MSTSFLSLQSTTVWQVGEQDWCYLIWIYGLVNSLIDLVAPNNLQTRIQLNSCMLIARVSTASYLGTHCRRVSHTAQGATNQL